MSRIRIDLLRNSRTTGPVSSAPPEGRASSFPEWRRAAVPCALAMALFACSLAAQTNGGNPAALMQHAMQLQQSGDYTSAAQAYRDFLKLQPNEVAAHVNLGVVLVKAGRFDEAISEYEAADKLLPGDPRIALNTALAYQKSGRLTEATQRYEAMHATAPQDDQVTMLLADCSLQMGNDDRVIDLLQPMAAKSSGDLGVDYMLGMALLRKGRIDEGQVFLDHILKNGDTAEARFLLGTKIYESGDYPGAVRQLASAIELNPALPGLESLYGNALLNTGDPDGAIVAFQKELASNPSDRAANLGLAQIREARLHPRPNAAAADEPGPKLHELAPPFELPEPVSGKKVSLADFGGRSPVVLIFGSYSCPNFRSAADALTAMQQRYGSKLAFLLVYIREAHANGTWQSTRNERESVSVAPAATFAEKQQHATMCSRKLHLRFPAVVDGMDGAVEKAYNAWPSRAFIIGKDGRILYSTRLTELDFHPQEMETILRSQVALP